MKYDINIKNPQYFKTVDKMRSKNKRPFKKGNNFTISHLTNHNLNPVYI